MKKVLFLCVHNSARSQMAEAYLRKFGGDAFEVESAGLIPGTLNPYVVRALQEDGIDISGKVPQDVLTLYKLGRRYSHVVTVCSPEAAEQCPIFPGTAARLHWPFPDPASFAGTDEQIMDQVRSLRNHIRDKVREFALREAPVR
ncbi:MAG TPA: arsenate reductase ArsC [Spirochaetia bacterium]|nr:arsenate reductase ArsC [Spirochaetia bacterium]